jgi:hypothetical protein
MSTQLLPAHAAGDFHHDGPETYLDLDFCNMYGERSVWDLGEPHSLQTKQHATASKHYLPSLIPSTSVPTDAKPRHSDAQPPGPPPAMSVAADTVPLSQQVTTVSPRQTCFDPSLSSPYLYSASKSYCTRAAASTDSTNSHQKYAADSSSTSQTSHKSTPTTTKPHTIGRKRKSESIEPDSARAVYLEKNRKAASKCRSKQKRQQEDLVEEARKVERKNKVLKAEVELLRLDICDLMTLVAQHSNCGDMRLSTYLQRGADRLAAAGIPKPSFAYPTKPSPGLYGKPSPLAAPSPASSSR